MEHKKKLLKYLTSLEVILGVYIVLSILVTVMKYERGTKDFMGGEYTNYNNYIIFKKSFDHLIEKQDLYTVYPEEYADLYKYSPTFALLMAPFSRLPDLAGLILWNLLNSLLLFFAIKFLPIKNNKTKAFILLFILIELITSLQNQQSNGLIVALLILSFNQLEKHNLLLPSLFIALTVYIKIFGIVAFILFLFYEKKTKFALYSIMWTLLLFALPLIVISFDQLKFLYSSWWNLLNADSSVETTFSVMTWLKVWFNLNLPAGWVRLAGLLLLAIPLIKINAYREFGFRFLFFAAVLIWVVIFNHKAESPTFIIAICGVAFWFFSQHFKIENIILVCFVFIFTILAPTDLFPRNIRVNILVPYVVKVFPCILVWLKIMFDLIFGGKDIASQINQKKGPPNGSP